MKIETYFFKIFFFQKWDGNVKVSTTSYNNKPFKFGILSKIDWTLSNWIGVFAITPFWKGYCRMIKSKLLHSILLLDKEHFEKKITFLSTFWKFHFFINLAYFRTPRTGGLPMMKSQKKFVNVFVYRMSIFWEGTGKKVSLSTPPIINHKIVMKVL